MIRPQHLKTGDRVALISTARKVSKEELEPAIKLYKSWGLEVEEGKYLYSSMDQFSGTDQERLYDLQKAINDPGIKAVFFARGGYGTARLLDKLDLSPLSKNAKWLVGYSDVTALLCHVYQKIRLASLHATMPINVKATPNKGQNAGISSLRSLLFGDSIEYPLKPHPLNRTGDAEGLLLGGNLSIIYSLLGSGSVPSTDGAILFLEDLDEYLYHVDRMVLNLKRNSLFDKLNGLIVGGMSDMNDNTTPFGKTAEEIIKDHVRAYDFPVYFGFPAGHVSPNLALPIGQKVKIINGKLMI